MDDEGQGAGGSFDIIEDMELEATQAEGGKVFIFCISDLCLPEIFFLTISYSQPFKPLFEDQDAQCM
jgi:hypothetical protein